MSIESRSRMHHTFFSRATRNPPPPAGADRPRKQTAARQVYRRVPSQACSFSDFPWGSISASFLEKGSQDPSPRHHLSGCFRSPPSQRRSCPAPQTATQARARHLPRRGGARQQPASPEAPRCLLRTRPPCCFGSEVAAVAAPLTVFTAQCLEQRGPRGKPGPPLSAVAYTSHQRNHPRRARCVLAWAPADTLLPPLLQWRDAAASAENRNIA